MDTRWRFNGSAYEHKCPENDPQAGYFVAVHVPRVQPQGEKMGMGADLADNAGMFVCRGCNFTLEKTQMHPGLLASGYCGKCSFDRDTQNQWRCRDCPFTAEASTISSLNRNSGMCNTCLMTAGRKFAEAQRQQAETGSAIKTLLSGHPEFYKILDEMAALHDKKNKDYGVKDDPLHNLREGAEAIGVEHWKAAFSRMGDKFTRIRSFIKKGTLANEGVEDSFLDIAVYAILALILFRETTEKGE